MLKIPPSLQKINPKVSAQAVKRAGNVARGRASKRNGASFEDNVEWALRAMATVAHVTRCDAIVHATGDAVLYREASGCDFVGLLDDKRAFVVECKSVAQRSGCVYASRNVALAYRKPRAAHITDAQRTQLDAYLGLGVSLLAVRLAGEVRVYPWSAVKLLAQVGADTPGWVASLATAMEPT